HLLHRPAQRSEPDHPLAFRAALRRALPAREVAARWALRNLREPISVRRLARRAGMPERTFCRRFLAQIGNSPARWLIGQRVSAAAPMESAAQSFRHVVRLEKVEMTFGKVQALSNVDFAVGRNEIVGLLGDNGAGKSTLIKIVSGVLRPTAGNVWVRDRPQDP